ncbi:hypothetical protein DM01DRAFT_1400161 [Hesseltinella vesiculosa]|uniref:Uncharacterized protein n=1 Tax=Hesseltinella vesiculosa TaxID=101127 RepID=A0A1X2GPU1_9FUNG|nr:hypothetical protein DM01DRAFT_1400161 [Hesseltinella vesiculosa]
MTMPNPTKTWCSGQRGRRCYIWPNDCVRRGQASKVSNKSWPGQQRFGRFAQDSSDKNGKVLTFAFLVVGNHATFYILHRNQSFYVMSEIL